MSDENELLKMKADAFDLRGLLDKLSTQGTQLAAAYNKLIEKIEEKEKEKTMSTTNKCANEDCRYNTKSMICGLLNIQLDKHGVCLNQEPCPPGIGQSDPTVVPPQPGTVVPPSPPGSIIP